jgi:cold shock CspA family protein
MRSDGTLAKWNDDRGFGFITPLEGGPEVFVHISAFPKDHRRPALGERLSFEIEIGPEGRKRAKNVLSARRQLVRPTHLAAHTHRRERRGFFGRAVPLLIVLGLAAYGYSEYSQRAAIGTALPAQTAGRAASGAASENAGDARQFAGTGAENRSAAASFRCDGRIYCSQMTSCAEAEFFLRNCPGVKMDGDHDGVPCEEQWCS